MFQIIKALDWKTWAAIAGGIVIGVLLATIFAVRNPTIEYKEIQTKDVKIVTKTVEVEKKVEVIKKEVREHIVIKTIEVVKPDGTKITTKEEVKDSGSDEASTVKTDSVNSTDKEEKQHMTTKIEYKETPVERSWSVTPMVGVAGLSSKIVYGGNITKHLVGPVSAGAWGMSSGEWGVSIMVEF